jgi:hypothetical protein
VKNSAAKRAVNAPHFRDALRSHMTVLQGLGEFHLPSVSTASAWLAPEPKMRELARSRLALSNRKGKRPPQIGCGRSA